MSMNLKSVMTRTLEDEYETQQLVPVESNDDGRKKIVEPSQEQIEELTDDLPASAELQMRTAILEAIADAIVEDAVEESAEEGKYPDTQEIEDEVEDVVEAQDPRDVRLGGEGKAEGELRMPLPQARHVPEVPDRLVVDRDRLRPKAREELDVPQVVLDHQVDVEVDLPSVGRLQGAIEGFAEGDFLDEASVHHVEVDHAKGKAHDLVHIPLEMEEVRREQGGADQARLFHRLASFTSSLIFR